MTKELKLPAFKCICFLFVLNSAVGRVCLKSTVDQVPELEQEISAKIELFKQDILNRLGYLRPPTVSNLTRSIEEKRKMIEEYKKYIEDRNTKRENNHQHTDNTDHDNVHSESTVTSNTYYKMEYNGEVPPQVLSTSWQDHNSVRLYFHSQLLYPDRDNTKELKINSAKMRIHFFRVKPENLKDIYTVDKLIRVNVFQILSIRNSSDYSRTLLDSKLVSLSEPSNVSFEISKAVQAWLNNNTKNLGIELATDLQDIHEVIEVDTDTSVTIIQHNNEKKFSSKPFVDVYAHQKDISKRVKRSTRRRGDCSYGDGETKCCRYPIKISFKDIGWDDWIIAPTEYEGYYCAGSCPYRHRMANNFALIKALLHRKHPHKVPLPCCSATKLSPFTILRYDVDGKYHFSDYPDLVVDQCKCG